MIYQRRDQKLNIIGKRFGKLIVLERNFSKPSKSYYATHWTCKCDCGKTTSVHRSSLISGNTKSCGCLAIETARKLSTKHGMSFTKEYKAWRSMMDRCYKPKNVSYHRYGGRGITVCEEWLKSFDNFFKDVRYAPSPKHSLGRINNNGNYEPKNVRWEENFMQNNNKITNTFITYMRKTHSLTEWGNIYGFPRHIITWRYHKGWSVDRIFNTPIRHKKPHQV